jgi:hypothetical protein
MKMTNGVTIWAPNAKAFFMPFLPYAWNFTQVDSHPSFAAQAALKVAILEF